MQLAIKRTTTFWNRKIVAVSTPTIKGVSKIDAEYETSSMEELHVACPNCGEYVPYQWENLKFTFEKGKKGPTVLGYLCEKCGALDGELKWKQQRVKWKAAHPERMEKRGFHLNELASPWKTWTEIVQDFLEAKRGGYEMMKVWHNTCLGLSWEDEAAADLEQILLKRRHYYGCEVPNDVVLLTAGVDVQDNRLEYEVVGWAKNKVSYGIRYGVLMGCPGQPQVWEELDQVLEKTYQREDGQALRVMTTCVDTGGHYTTEAYEYCKKREPLRVWPIKGKGGSGIPFVKRPGRRNEAGVWLFLLGVDAGKDTVFSRLQVNFDGEAGFCHFPMEPRGYDQQYFVGLTAEKRTIRSERGRLAIRWELRRSGLRNEPFDIRNYATAALEILNPDLETLYLRLNEHKNPKTVKPVRRGKKGIEIY